MAGSNSFGEKSKHEQSNTNRNTYLGREKKRSRTAIYRSGTGNPVPDGGGKTKNTGVSRNTPKVNKKHMLGERVQACVF